MDNAETPQRPRRSLLDALGEALKKDLGNRGRRERSSRAGHLRFSDAVRLAGAEVAAAPPEAVAHAQACAECAALVDGLRAGAGEAPCVPAEPDLWEPVAPPAAGPAPPGPGVRVAAALRLAAPLRLAVLGTGKAAWLGGGPAPVRREPVQVAAGAAPLGPAGPPAADAGRRVWELVDAASGRTLHLGLTALDAVRVRLELWIADAQGLSVPAEGIRFEFAGMAGSCGRLADFADGLILQAPATGELRVWSTDPARRLEWHIPLCLEAGAVGV